LIYQLTDFDRSLDKMTFLEKDAGDAVDIIRDAEKNQRILRTDIGHLEGEKTDLEYERETLETSLGFISRFTGVMVVLFGLMSLFLAYLFMFNDISIFFPSTVLILLVILIVALMYMFRKRMRYELQMNIKKQQRAVALLNKKNVIFAYYTNFLRYEYRKYKVRNSQMLSSHLKEYKNYKHITTRIDNVRKIMYETEHQIGRFLREKNIAYNAFAIEQFAQTVNIEDKVQYSRELVEEKDVLEKSLQSLDDKHQEIWERMESVNALDTSPERLVDKMIQLYFDEVSRLFVAIDIGIKETGE